MQEEVSLIGNIDLTQIFLAPIEFPIPRLSPKESRSIFTKREVSKLSVKRKIVSIFCFSGCTIYVATTRFCLCSTKAAIDKM